MIAAGSHGPIVVIPNGIDVPESENLSDSARTADLLIAGLKQPVLAARAAETLAAPGRSIDILTEHVPQNDFFAVMRRARVTLFLPNEEEGFYLPALEGMALGTLVVCPDCVGNRSFCLPGLKAFRPGYRFKAVIEAARMALALPEHERQILLDNGRETARNHSLAVEREAFGRVLSDLDALWATG